MPQTKGMALRGAVTVNGVDKGSAGAQQGYVQQDDLMFSQLTVRETLTLAAQLRLPGGSSDADQRRAVDDLLQRLGLSASADTIVGNAKTRRANLVVICLLCTEVGLGRGFQVQHLHPGSS